MARLSWRMPRGRRRKKRSLIKGKKLLNESSCSAGGPSTPPATCTVRDWHHRDTITFHLVCYLEASLLCLTESVDLNPLQDFKMLINVMHQDPPLDYSYD